MTRVRNTIDCIFFKKIPGSEKLENIWNMESSNDALEQEFVKTMTPAPSVLWELYTHWGVRESMKVFLECRILQKTFSKI